MSVYESPARPVLGTTINARAQAATVQGDLSNYRILTGYRFALLELRALERQYDRLLFVGGPHCAAGTGIYGEVRATNDSESARIQAQDGLLKDVEEARTKLIRMVEGFEAILRSVTNDRLRCLLRLYYGDGYTDEHVADEMGISRKTVVRIRVKFLSCMSLNVLECPNDDVLS